MVVKVKNSQDLKKALENKEDYEFDTSVVFDRDTASYKTVLDVEDFIRNAPRTNRVWEKLYETISKLKKTKEGALFFNAVAHKLGEDMKVKWSDNGEGIASVYLYGVESNDLGYYLDALLPSYGVKLDPEADMVRMMVHRNWDDMRFWKPGKIRFDGDNKLHNNLARIINQLPEKSGFFRKFKDAWIRDTQPSEHIKKIKEQFDKQEAEEGIERIENAVWPYSKYNTNLEILVSNYYKTYKDYTRAKVAKWAVKNAPVDRAVAVEIAKFLPTINPIKGFGLKEINDLIEDFYKRYGDVIEELKQEGKDLLPQIETAKEEQKNLKAVLADRDKLYRKNSAWSEFREHLGTLRNDFYDIMQREPLTKKEKTFYKALYDKLNEQIETFLKTKDGSVLENIQIEGHPWVLWGTKREEDHLKWFGAVLNKYNNYIAKIPAEYTDEDRIKYAELDKRHRESFLAGEPWHSDAKYKEDKEVKNLQEKLKSVEGQIEKIDEVEVPKKKYAKIYAEAKKKLEEKRKETPVVESEYMKWRQDVESGVRKKQLDELMKKMKPANPGLTEEQLMALAVRVMQEKSKR